MAAAPTAATPLAHLGVSQLLQVFEFLTDPQSLSILAGVSPKWAFVASLDVLWARAFENEAPAFPYTPLNAALPTPRRQRGGEGALATELLLSSPQRRLESAAWRHQDVSLRLPAEPDSAYAVCESGWRMELYLRRRALAGRTAADATACVLSPMATLLQRSPRRRPDDFADSYARSAALQALAYGGGHPEAAGYASGRTSFSVATLPPASHTLVVRYAPSTPAAVAGSAGAALGAGGVGGAVALESVVRGKWSTWPARDAANATANARGSRIGHRGVPVGAAPAAGAPPSPWVPLLDVLRAHHFSVVAEGATPASIAAAAELHAVHRATRERAERHRWRQIAAAAAAAGYAPAGASPMLLAGAAGATGSAAAAASSPAGSAGGSSAGSVLAAIGSAFGSFFGGGSKRSPTAAGAPPPSRTAVSSSSSSSSSGAPGGTPPVPPPRVASSPRVHAAAPPGVAAATPLAALGSSGTGGVDAKRKPPVHPSSRALSLRAFTGAGSSSRNIAASVSPGPTRPASLRSLMQPSTAASPAAASDVDDATADGAASVGGEDSAGEEDEEDGVPDDTVVVEASDAARPTSASGGGAARPAAPLRTAPLRTASLPAPPARAHVASVLHILLLAPTDVLLWTAIKCLQASRGGRLHELRLVRCLTVVELHCSPSARSPAAGTAGAAAPPDIVIHCVTAGPQARGFDALFLEAHPTVFDATLMVVDAAALYPARPQPHDASVSGLAQLEAQVATDIDSQLVHMCRCIGVGDRQLFDKPLAVLAARQHVLRGDAGAAAAAATDGAPPPVLPPLSPLLVSYLLRAVLSSDDVGLDRGTLTGMIWSVHGCGGAGARAVRWGFDRALAWAVSAAARMTSAESTPAYLLDRRRFVSDTNMSDVAAAWSAASGDSGLRSPAGVVRRNMSDFLVPSSSAGASDDLATADSAVGAVAASATAPALITFAGVHSSLAPTASHA